MLILLCYLHIIFLESFSQDLVGWGFEWIASFILYLHFFFVRNTPLGITLLLQQKFTVSLKLIFNVLSPYLDVGHSLVIPLLLLVTIWAFLCMLITVYVFQFLDI